MFPPIILDAVDNLMHKYGRKKRRITAAYPIIEITVEESTRITCYQLFFIDDEYLEIQNPTYQYYSKISHYDFKGSEQRWSRDKRTVFSIIEDLKDCGLWEMVRNKDFIKINEKNTHSDKEALKKEIGDIID
jgi:hypothetical protein